MMRVGNILGSHLILAEALRAEYDLQRATKLAKQAEEGKLLEQPEYPGLSRQQRRWLERHPKR